MIRTRFYTLLLVSATALAASASDVSLEALPDGGSGYKVDPYIRAAISLQSLGRGKACTKLLELERGDEGYEKVAVLCRMLFMAKSGEEFKRPALGGAMFWGGTGYSDWPLEPIECVDGVPFYIAGGYVGAGARTNSYMRYCMTDCAWSSFHWRMPTGQEKRAAFEKLLASKKWKKPLDEEGKEFFSAQIEDVK